jgi:hypothetical protein
MENGCRAAMGLSRCWVRANAARAEIAPRDVKARETQKTTAMK